MNVGNPRHKNTVSGLVLCCHDRGMLPKVPTFGCRADMSPTCRQLSQPRWQGELFLMYQFCFFLPFLPPSFCVPPAAPAAAAGAFAASCSIRSVGVGGSVKEDGRFRANVPKRMLSIRRWQSRMLLLILSRWVAVMQSSSQSWKRVLMAYINLQQNLVSVRTWALKDCFDLLTSWITDVMA